MGYQTSTCGSKVGSSFLRLVIFVCLITDLSVVSAYTTTNPLMGEVTISAVILQGSNVYPETQPTSPVTQTVIDTTDSVIFKGLSYPESVISLLKNGLVVAQVPASPNGTFEIRIRNLSSGVYTFGVRAEDKDTLKSKLLTFSVYVSTSITTVIDGIFIPPTITSDKIEVKRGEIITFLGTSVPDSDVRISFHSDFELLKKAKSNASGTWIYKLDSSELELGEHEGKARSLTADDLSPYSDILPFLVTDTDRLRTKKQALFGFRKKCDLNNDDRVNLLDFSIMAFWYKRIGFPQKVDLNTDNNVNLTDLSILAYCWTG